MGEWADYWYGPDAETVSKVRADLSALTRGGLLKAYVALVEDLDREPRVGDRIIVLDMMGGDDAYAAEVVSIEDKVMLLDVDWDEPKVSSR